MKRMILFTFLALVAGATAVAAQSVAKSYSYFSIGGRTLDEIDKELSARGPKVGGAGKRHPGATRMRFSSNVTYASSNRGCTIDKAVVSVDATIILPRWGQRKRADGDTRLIWDTLSADIKRHEESHVQIARRHARELEQALRGLGRRSDCEALKRDAAALSARVLAAHDRAQERFDRIEGINFENRMMRLLSYRLQREEAAKRRN